MRYHRRTVQCAVEHCGFSVLLAVVVSLSACGSPPPIIDAFSEYVPLQARSVSTDIIYPSLLEFDALLGRGWEPLDTEQPVDQGRWIDGRIASFRFYAALEDAVTLELEGSILPRPRRPPQILSVRLNDQPVGETTTTPGWHTYEIALPEESLRQGWNRIELLFQQVRRLNDDSPRRMVAANIRRLRLISPFDRPVWADRPDEILVREAEDEARVVIDMPTDSVLDTYLELEEGMSLTGAVDPTFAEPAGTRDIWAAIEVLDASGEEHTIFQRAYDSVSGDREHLEIDLSRWANQLVRIRLRSWGRSNGVVRWHGLGLARRSGGTAVRQSDDLLAPPRSGRLAGRDVIFVILDAARADAFEEGYGLATPHVDALAAEGTRFTRAWAPAPWTGQTIPALLTGWHPSAIGAEVWSSQIPAPIPTLPELLHEHGYFTVLWSQHVLYEGNESLRRGFESSTEVSGWRDAFANRRVLPEPHELFVDDRPTFALIHLLPPHTPYSPPEPFLGSLTTWFEGKFKVDVAALDRLSGRTDTNLSAADVRYARGRYDENVMFADHLVGTLLHTIPAAGRYENALIAVFSDHGEGFFEHGRFLHSPTLYDEFLRLPLIVKWPQRSGFADVVTQPGSLIDLAPTLFDGLGLSDDRARFHGRSLLPLVFDGASLHRNLFAETRGTGAPSGRVNPSYALQSGLHKVILTEKSGVTELYDLGSDPGEQVDINSTESLRARLLLQELLLQRYRNQVALAEAGGQHVAPLDPDVVRRLSALGYFH